MLTTDTTRPLHADPLADEVEAHLRETGMIAAPLPEWNRKTIEATIDLPNGQLLIEKGADWKITPRFRNNGGCWCAIYLPGTESIEQIERDGPGLVVAALELLATDIRRWLAAKEALSRSEIVEGKE